MRSSIRSTVFLLGGALAGLLSAHLAIARSGGAGAGAAAEWRSFAAPADGNPYRAAHHLLAGRLPPPPQVLAEFEASDDSSGAGLTGACAYRMVFRGMAARWWQLRAVSQAAAAAQDSLSSSAVPRAADGGFELRISHAAEPGHWLDPGTAGGFTLVFTAAAGDARFELPRVERTGCG